MPGWLSRFKENTVALNNYVERLSHTPLTTEGQPSFSALLGCSHLIDTRTGLCREEGELISPCKGPPCKPPWAL